MEKTHSCKSPCIKPLGPWVGPAVEMADLQLSCLLPQKPSSEPGQGGAAAPVRHSSGELWLSPLHMSLLPVYTRHWQPYSLDNLQIFLAPNSLPQIETCLHAPVPRRSGCSFTLCGVRVWTRSAMCAVTAHLFLQDVCVI